MRINRDEVVTCMACLDGYLSDDWRKCLPFEKTEMQSRCRVAFKADPAREVKCIYCKADYTESDGYCLPKAKEGEGCSSIESRNKTTCRGCNVLDGWYNRQYITGQGK